LSHIPNDCFFSLNINAVIYVLFFLSYGDNRALHSFPTRRSSDLVWIFQTTGAGALRQKGLARASQGGLSVGDTYTINGFAAKNRSEEHTSELQSRGHLVCRLLLEKKNKHKKIAVDTVNENLPPIV